METVSVMTSSVALGGRGSNAWDWTAESCSLRDLRGPTVVHPPSSSVRWENRVGSGSRLGAEAWAIVVALARVTGPSPAMSEGKPGPRRRFGRRDAPGVRGWQSAAEKGSRRHTGPWGTLFPLGLSSAVDWRREIILLLMVVRPPSIKKISTVSTVGLLKNEQGRILSQKRQFRPHSSRPRPSRGESS